MTTRLLSALFVFGSTVPVAAQGSVPADISTAQRDWRARFGERWSAAIDPVTGRAEMIYGGRAEWGGRPMTDEDWVARAQTAIADSSALHGVDVATLVPDRVTLLPLGIVGSGDKWSVDLHQAFGGVPVEGGDVVALFDARGGLLSIQTHALTDVRELELEPLFPAATAREQALLAFEKEYAPSADSVADPVLVILPIEADAGRVGRLAWRIDVGSHPAGADPVGRRYWVDARLGYPLRDETIVHFFDISGHVSMMATPGTYADAASNPETVLPAKYIKIQHASGTVYADVNGDFTIPGSVPSQPVTFSFSGLYGTANDQPSGLPYTETFTLNPGPGNNVLLNSGSIDTITSQANIFNHTATVRDYVRATVPSDSTADIVFVGHANIADTCNAYYNGSSINFYAAGGSCNNTAFSTVVAHEQGHWLNDRYGTGNGSDGMGEGNADVWAIYTFDTPHNGDGFFTSGGYVRTGTNTRQFCGDCAPGCYGEVHSDGEPWMGAAWKVRVNLDNSLGNALGDQTANLLFLSWMNGYNQTQIRSIIELQWLILDDNDANLANGTPHGTDIKNGFRVQGFPGYDIEYTSTSTVPEPSCEATSYPVTAAVHTLQGTTITGVALSWRVNGGAWNTNAMAPTGGENWAGQIPYVVSPANVEYTVTATDSAGHTKTGFCGTRSFFIGQVVAFVTDGLEGAGTWTTASVGDTTNANNDWQQGTPAGKTGTSQGVAWTDPAAAAAGTACRGNDLGLNGGNGAYQANVHSYLRSAPFDCTGQTGVQLIFKRWLTVEKSQYDTARILVNGNEVWRNPAAVNLLDTSWTTQSIDISALADNNPSVVLQFELQSDGGLELGGWQVDAISLGRIVPAPPCSGVQSYCAGDGSTGPCPCGNTGTTGRGCQNSAGTGGARLTVAGSTSPDTIVLTSTGELAVSPGIFLQGDTTLPSPVAFGDGLRCAGGILKRLYVKAAAGGTMTAPVGGDPSVSQQSANLGDPISPGTTRVYQAYYRDPDPAFCPAPTGNTFNVTNAIRITW